MTGIRQRASGAHGQSLIEFALVLPLILIVILGVIEVSYALLDQHVVTKLSREGSNLISRDTSLLDASTAMKNMSTGPVDFTTSSTVILSVIKDVNTAGAGNFNKAVLYQRYQMGAIAAVSTLTTLGGGAFGGAPDFLAANSDNDANLQVTNLPANLIVPGGLLYVTEIFSKHPLITPFDKFGVQVPTTLYSIAYF
jgi:Flp pilus assembly protein TadG